MSKFGFIGYGNMGSTLIDGFLSSGALVPGEVMVSSRTEAGLSPLLEKWPETSVTCDNRRVARESRTLFICVKPLDAGPVLEEIKGVLSDDTHLVSIAACVTISNLETMFGGMITKVIPSVISQVKEGVSLFCHNSKVDHEGAGKIERLFESIGKVVLIDEDQFEVAADLTSCAPGMIAAIFQNFVEAGLRHSRLSQELAQDMVISTLLGTAKLLMAQELGFPELISRVATKGGITEEAAKVLNDGLPGLFDEVFNKTLGKHEAVKSMVREQMGAAE
ncbi:MAG: pyrroline-5-carboxylate reductase dimerization domain-containing protein [candidate division NC10 bacterium]